MNVPDKIEASKRARLERAASRFRDPLMLGRLLWPNVNFYDRQREIIYSVRDNFETVVVAGHMLGKDFVTAFIVLWFFLTRHPCRVITTSVDYPQLQGVLWGEMRAMIQTAAYPLDSEKGGPLVVNDLHIRKVVGGEIDGLSYIKGRVAAQGEGMQGHHLPRTGDSVPRTLAVADEASGVDDKSFDAVDTWAERKLIIGNPYACENHFRKAVREGNVLMNDALNRPDTDGGHT